MSRLSLRRLALLSRTQRAGRLVDFDESCTLFIGANHVGKSALLKSIYWTLGADTGLAEAWKRANVSTLLEFEINGEVFTCLRNSAGYALFREGQELIGRYRRLSDGFDRELAKLFGAHLVLSDRDKRPTVAPPAVYFMPFYIDQDQGWTNSWNSFGGLGNLPDWRRSVVEYHLGISPDEYHRLEAERKLVKSRLTDAEGKLSVFEEIMRKLGERLRQGQFDFDIQAYEREISELIEQSNILKDKEERFKDEVTGFRSEAARLKMERLVAGTARAELEKDHKFLETHDDVECPMCGTVHANGVAERFNLAADIERCTQLLEEIAARANVVDEKMERAVSAFREMSEERVRIETILKARQGELSLREIVQAEGKREVFDDLREELEGLRTEVRAEREQLERLTQKAKSFFDTRRVRTIKDFFMERLQSNARQLAITGLGDDFRSRPYSRIKAGGSTTPRLVLANFYSVLQTKRQFHGGSLFAPQIIDAMQQQEQDDDNLKRMISLVRDSYSDFGQLVLGLVDTHGIELPGTVVELQHKHELLRREQYSECVELLRAHEDLGGLFA